MKYLKNRLPLLKFTAQVVAWVSVATVGLLNAADRPNVVLILADDQAYGDFGFMGNDWVHTPNLDRLAGNSARYLNGYVPMSVCRPSLATLLTGLYPHQHGIFFNHPPPGLATMRSMSAADYQRTRATTDYLIQQVPTLPRLLAEAGYVCLQTGKHWEGSFRTAGFTHGMTLAAPSDRLGEVTGTRLQANGQWVAHGNGDAGLVIGRETMQPIATFLADYAGKQPFFIWYAPFLPHTPFDAPERYRTLYQGRPVPEFLLPYYAEIARFDETVGELLGLLEQHDMQQQTLIVFASDNGFQPDVDDFQKQNKRSKLSVYEDGLRTPLLLCWPGVIRPAEYVQPVSTVDVVPTVLSAVGLDVQDGAGSSLQMEELPGLNLMPSAKRLAPPVERPVFGAIFPNDAQELENPARDLRARWVRSGDFKLILPGRGPAALELQLYDLKSDPRETVNLAGRARYADLQGQLTQLLDDWWTPAE